MLRKLFLLLFIISSSLSKSQDTIRVNPDINPQEQAEIYYNKGVEAAKTNSLVEAIALFSKSLYSSPSFEKALLNRSIAFNKLHKYDEALRDINDALNLNKQNAELYYNKSLIFFSTHQKDSQNIALDNCLKINANHSEASYYRGVNYFQDNNITDAVKFFSISITTNPNYAFALNDLGSCYRVQQNTDSAIYFYERAIKADSNLSHVHNNLGSAFLAKKKHDAALKEFTKAYQLDNTNFNALLNRGVLNFEINNLKGAQRDFEDVLAEKPNNSFAYNNLASIAIKNKDFKTAITLSSRAIELDKDNGAAYYNRGIAYQMLKQEDACCADWKKAYSLGIIAAKNIYNSNCSN